MGKIYASSLALIAVSLSLLSCVKGLYFMLGEGAVRCFKDELIKSTVSYSLKKLRITYP